MDTATRPTPRPGGPRLPHRPAKWGNPFSIDTDGDRETVIQKYREWIMGQSNLLADVHELRGKRLGCWCAPQACHGDVLAELANSLQFE